ncbi:MAG: RNA polymerase sigma-70 factor [Tannerella sp.]|jgi:RNA polymerase sigma-70 factor (ECF subfamily)|nr:RNA polymerase sigma-70 factor [Tannerella sp.]
MLQDINKQEDSRLFELLQNGDGKAFDTIFLKYYSGLCAYARQYVSLSDAEEVVQDIMTWFWENKSMIVFESSLRNYLFKSVKNRCITLINRDELRRKIINVVHKNLEQLYDEPDFYIEKELTDKIESALKELPETYREAFELNRFNNLSYKEIALRLQLSPKTIDYRIQQALKILRIKLKDYLPLLLFLQ